MLLLVAAKAWVTARLPELFLVGREVCAQHVMP